MFDDIFSFIRELYPASPVSLHQPKFCGREKEYVIEAIDSTFVSSVGKMVDDCEAMLARLLHVKKAVLVMNGTAALHLALKVIGVRPGDEVITQALSFVATANAIKYLEAEPVFVDIHPETLGMCPESLKNFLQKNVVRYAFGEPVNRISGRRIAACVPMHTLGHSVHLDEILQACQEYGIPVIEDAAESLGAEYKGKPTGSLGLMGVLSFNGNKIVTSGGGGAIVTNDEALGNRLKHLSTTAKKGHPYEYVHDEVGYNYRLPNLNAALLKAQLEQLTGFLAKKRDIAESYKKFFSAKRSGINFFSEPSHGRSNYWLNAIIFPDHRSQQSFLKESLSKDVMCRPLWKPLPELEMYKYSIKGDLTIALELARTVVNLPSGVP